MGQLIYFVAGTSVDVLPAKHIGALLLNIPNNAEDDRKIKASKNLIGVAQPRTVMLDSGGYQLLVGQENGLEVIYDEIAPIYQPGTINLTPWHLIRGAVKIQPNILVGLDYPVKKIREKEKQETEFRYKLGFNADYAIQTAQLREKHCPQIKLLLPIQCYNLDHFERYRRLVTGVRFDGYSMPVRNLKLGEIALFLLKFRQLGIREVHLLGTLSFFTIALSAYMARHLFDWVSLDATTWRIQAQYSSYMNPHDLSVQFVGEDAKIDGNIKMDCQCPWCKGKTFSYIKCLPYTERTAFLRCHNHFVIDRICRELYDNASTLSNLKRYLMGASTRPEKVNNLIDLLGALEICKDLDPSIARDFLMGTV